MTHSTIRTTQKKKEHTKKILEFRKSELIRSDWPIFTIGILAIGCWYFVLRNLADLPYVLIYPYPNMLIQPTFVAFLVAIFSSIYLYSSLTARPVRQSVRIIGHVLSVVLILAILYVVAGWGSMCSGLFGGQTPCITTNYITIYVLLLNPFVLPIFSIISVFGTVKIVIDLNKKK